jgi:SAM-dependent methyltransferase
MSTFYLSLADWRLLYRLGRNRLASEDSYREFQVFQGTLLLRFLQSRGIAVRGRRVADIGCGYGGYSLALNAAGSLVVALDLFQDGWPTALAAQMSTIAANALHIPLQANTFDIVVCASLIEHVAEPQQLVAELARIARPGGVVYVSFPPFYSPRGGHQFSPFHYLGERRAIALSQRLRGRKSDWVRNTYPDAPASFNTLWGGWGLYVLTISKFERCLIGSPLLLRERSTRLLPVDFSGLPILREILTWHVQYLLEKPTEH